jgi:hypothetical protein
MPKPRHKRGERQMRLRPEYAHLYQGIPPNEWWPAWLMAERLLALAESKGLPPEERICNPNHFLFRGGQGPGQRLLNQRTRRADLRP